MFNNIYHILFFVISLYSLAKTIFYGIYEINTQKNKSGGIIVIVFSTLVVIFSNIIMFLN